jgi:hypothetical protein
MQAEVVLQWRDDCAHASQITGEWYYNSFQALDSSSTALCLCSDFLDYSPHQGFPTSVPWNLRSVRWNFIIKLYF